MKRRIKNFSYLKHVYIHIYILSVRFPSNILTFDSYDIVIDLFLNSLHARLSSLVKQYKTTIHYLKKM